MEILEASDKRWQDGDMRVRRTAAGMLVAEEQFRRIVTEVPRESIEHAPVNGHLFLPIRGHRFSPLVAIVSPHWRPSNRPAIRELSRVIRSGA